MHDQLQSYIPKTKLKQTNNPANLLNEEKENSNVSKFCTAGHLTIMH
jgi:hypothetical protein